MTETVKIQIFAPIEKVAPKNDRRHYLAGVYIDGKNKRACATDGKILAVQKLENVDDENVMHGDHCTIAPKAFMDQARKAADGTIEVNGESVVYNDKKTGFEVKAKPVDGTYPNIDRIIPDKDAAHHVVALDAALLKVLQDALGEKKGVRLHFPKNPRDSIYVESISNDDVFGVIMPMRA